MIFARLRDLFFGPRHTDWRATVDYRWRRWNGSRWEYRDMTEDEQRDVAQFRIW
ncbi:MAG: hypothetical protein ABIF45_17335 [Pseudomonadota bacterium]